MLIARRLLLVASCLTLVAAAACGGGPTAPSGGGTTITGTVTVNGGAAAAPGAAATGLTVTVVGTNLTVTVEASGFFQITGVSSGDVQLLFRDAIVNATIELNDVDEALVEIEVQVTGASAVVVSEARTDHKVTLCHSTGNGSYRSISVSTAAEPAHRGHGDGKVGEKVPGEDLLTFGENCQMVGPDVEVEKSTNGEDADRAPGPRIPVGSAVNWQYVVTNTGTLNLTDIVVVDDDASVTVTCPGAALTPGQSMTCTASGIATAGQYMNEATVTAMSTSGQVSDTDVSHYFGVTEDDDDGLKVQLCHKTGAGFYVPIEVSVNAVPAHLAHGDGKIGEAVPGNPGKVFGQGCSVM